MSDNTEIDELPLDEDIEAVDELAEPEAVLSDAETKPRKRFGAPALMTSAFLSSVIGGGVVWLASQYYAPKAADMTPLQTRLEALSNDVAALNAENEKLKTSVSSLENAPKAMDVTGDVSAPVDLEPIETRLTALEDAKPTEIDPELVTRLEALQSSGSEALDLSDILSRLDNIEKTASEKPDLPDVTEAELTELTARLDALENRPVSLQPVATLTAVSMPVSNAAVPVEFPTDMVLASLPKEGGWLERSLKKHISVQSEENPRYLVELIQKNIETDDLDGARAAFDKLPPEAKAAAQAWRDSLKN